MLKKESEILEPFNTIVREYPDGSVFMKKLKFTVFKKPNGWELEERKLPDDVKEFYEAVPKETYSSITREFRQKQNSANIEILRSMEKDDVSSVAEDTLVPIKQIPVEFSAEEIEKKREKKILNNIARTRNSIFDISRSNEFNFFITLTFSVEKCDRYSFQECSKKVRFFMNRFRTENKETCPNFKYLLVHEQHKDGAYHYHGLIYLENLDSLKLADKQPKNCKYPVYNWSRWKNGFSTATEIDNQEACRKYILKYISKNIDEDYQKGQRHFYYSQNCLKPKKSTLLLSEECLNVLESSKIYDTERSCGYELIEKE